MAVNAVNEISPSPEWIAELAPRLERYLEWIMANRDSDGSCSDQYQLLDCPRFGTLWISFSCKVYSSGYHPRIGKIVS